MVRYDFDFLRGATSLLGALEGVGPENRDILGPEMARAKHITKFYFRIGTNRNIINSNVDSKSLMPKAAGSTAAAGTWVTAKAGSPTATGTSATAEEQQMEGRQQQQEPGQQ